MNKLAGLYQLPDFCLTALGTVINCLGNAWLKLDKDSDFLEAATLIAEARRLVCTAMDADSALPPEEETGISRESLKDAIFGLVRCADEARDELEALSSNHAAACTWVEGKGSRVFLLLSVSLNSLCAGSTLRQLCPPASSTLN